MPSRSSIRPVSSRKARRSTSPPRTTAPAWRRNGPAARMERSAIRDPAFRFAPCGLHRAVNIFERDLKPGRIEGEAAVADDVRENRVAFPVGVMHDQPLVRIDDQVMREAGQ